MAPRPKGICDNPSYHPSQQEYLSPTPLPLSPAPSTTTACLRRHLQVETRHVDCIPSLAAIVRWSNPSLPTTLALPTNLIGCSTGNTSKLWSNDLDPSLWMPPATTTATTPKYPANSSAPLVPSSLLTSLGNVFGSTRHYSKPVPLSPTTYSANVPLPPSHQLSSSYRRCCDHPGDTSLHT
jgi:hypothetical protein